MSKAIDISVIVPIYNTASFLEKCIISLIEQTYENFEILLIDDGSTDNSFSICQKYADKCSKIRIFKKKNGGLSSARNYGINQARGEYLTFLDSDDWFENTMLEKMLEKYKDYNLEVIIQGFQVDFENDGSSYLQVFEKNKIFKLDRIYEGIRYIEQSGLFNSSCNKLYKRKIIEQNTIYFEEGQEPAEDLLFNCNYFKYVHSIGCIKNPGYHYIKRNQVSLTVIYMPNYEKRIVSFGEARKNLYEAVGMPQSDMKNLLYNTMASYTLTAFSNLYRITSPLKFRERNEAIRYMYRQHEIIEGVLSSQYTNLFLKILRCMVKIKNVTVTNIIFTILYKCRYHFEEIYLKMRKRILYSQKR